MTAWLKVTIIVFILVTIMLAAILIIGDKRQKKEIKDLVDKLVSASSVENLYTVDFASLAALPKPVERYFRHVLSDGQNIFDLVRFQQVGELRIDPKSENWSPFQASYFVSQNPASFIWDAKINIAPFLHVRVRDSLLEGVGAGKVSLMSVFTLGSDEDKPELNSGALYRYLAEAVWHPTALLPEAGVKWEAVDESKAIAHLTRFGISISLEFGFNSLGEITDVYTEDRFGKFGDVYIKYPWEGRFSDYQEFSDVKLPTRGEVGWHLPDGWWLFWRGEIVNAEFEIGNLSKKSTKRFK